MQTRAMGRGCHMQKAIRRLTCDEGSIVDEDVSPPEESDVQGCREGRSAASMASIECGQMGGPRAV